ncbi:hypothetical protein VaNZ11_012590 [Volvox africanus]|uniref:GCK domain-containing protein n=1 Tax=Volvox africanus TaxID=51714 RepID=A0ABQ5SE86_9CHLO|nr:hypothetical protein VaNZ11_012590 [Volvox africanus]
MYEKDAAPSSAATANEDAVPQTTDDNSTSSDSIGGDLKTNLRPSVEEENGRDMSRCPICQFIEAGECKVQHQTWVQCRTEAKAAGKDYIEECQDHFKAFLQCAIEHRDYYEPFLEMLGGMSDEEGGNKTEAQDRKDGNEQQ